jgi:choline dehydrogenase
MIHSADPHEAPRIVANAYGDPQDLAEMVEGVKLLRRLAAQPALAEIIAEELAPGPATTSDAEFADDLRRRSGTVYHPVGTCRMGPAPGAAAVDARLRVHGMEALRVADASVFPSIISGNTNATAVMVGAKAASMIRADQR